jgi:hypothetical protein
MGSSLGLWPFMSETVIDEFGAAYLPEPPEAA